MNQRSKTENGWIFNNEKYDVTKAAYLNININKLNACRLDV